MSKAVFTFFGDKKCQCGCGLPLDGQKTVLDTSTGKYRYMLVVCWRSIKRFKKEEVA